MAWGETRGRLEKENEGKASSVSIKRPANSEQFGLVLKRLYSQSRHTL